MARFVVQIIEAGDKSRSRRRAKRHRRIVEEEVRDILRNAAGKKDAPVDGLGTEIAALFKKIGLDDEIPELHGHMIKPGA